MRDRRDRLDVGEIEGGVRRRLDEDDPRIRPDRGVDRGEVGGVDEIGLDVEAGQDLLEQSGRSPVEGSRADDVVAGAQEGGEEPRLRGETGGVANCRRRALQLTEGALEDGDGRIGFPGVLVDREALQAIAAERRRLDDRCYQGLPVAPTLTRSRAERVEIERLVACHAVTPVSRHQGGPE